MSATQWIGLALLGIGLAGCTHTTTEPLTDEVAGRWELQSVNGGSLPYVMRVEEGRQLELHLDDFVLHRNGVLTGRSIWLIRYESGVVDTASMEARGSWARAEGKIIFMPSGVKYSQTSVLGIDALTLRTETHDYVYQR